MYAYVGYYSLNLSLESSQICLRILIERNETCKKERQGRALYGRKHV
jgi:hypothetical protein